ncbi:MAG: hypothetical protein KBF89_01175 [Acidimicrobiia bacterium]|nr:hypothetical protein [Acidimicrobiia bacterium]
MNNSLRPVRDSQRIKVYRANTGVLGTAYPSMLDIEKFCVQVQTSKIWSELFPRDNSTKPPILKPGKGAKTAHVIWHHDGRIEIAFPKAYRYGTYVLHELTHYGIGLRYDIAAHGPEFVGYFLSLVDEFCSTRTSNALRRAMTTHKVRVYIPHRMSLMPNETRAIKDKENQETQGNLNNDRSKSSLGIEELKLFDDHGHTLTSTNAHSF